MFINAGERLPSITGIIAYEESRGLDSRIKCLPCVGDSQGPDGLEGLRIDLLGVVRHLGKCFPAAAAIAATIEVTYPNRVIDGSIGVSRCSGIDLSIA